MREILLQSCSLLGALMILGAFVLLQRGHARSTGRWYLLANFTGSFLLAIVAIMDRRIGFILLESVWAAVSLWSMIRPAPPPVT